VSQTITPSAQRVLVARNAVLLVFGLNGAAFMAFASRIPDAKAELHLSPGQLGLTLLAASAGSLTALPFSGRIADRVGAARAILAGMTVSLTGLVVVGAAVDLAGSRALMAVGLYLLGMGIGVWDVSMNLEGATVERLMGRTVMPHFHAAFSGGTVLLALVGSLLSWAGVSLMVQYTGAALVIAAAVVRGLRAFLPREVEVHSDEGSEPATPTAVKPRAAWLEPRTLLVGLVVLAAGFTEGTANDWVSVGFVEGHDVPPWAGILALATFLAAMTTGRVLGTRLLDRHGRVPVLRVTFVLAAVGSLLVVFGDTALAYTGAAVWGVGASLGFPVGMSASADDPARAGARMSVVATIGYTAFIAGPPLLGFLGDHFTVLRALLVVTVMAAVAMLVIPATREQRAG
jgi:MFS family permease